MHRLYKMGKPGGKAGVKKKAKGKKATAKKAAPAPKPAAKATTPRRGAAQNSRAGTGSEAPKKRRVPAQVTKAGQTPPPPAPPAEPPAPVADPEADTPPADA